VGAGERSPSAPRLKPSIVNEQRGKAPRVEPFVPRSPDLASSEEGSGSSAEPSVPHSPFVEPHSLPFGPSEGEDEPRGLLFGWHSLLFERHSLRFASSEAGGTSREEEGTAWEQEGTPSKGLYG